MFSNTYLGFPSISFFLSSDSIPLSLIELLNLPLKLVLCHQIENIFERKKVAYRERCLK